MSTCKLYTFVSILCFVIIRTSAEISLAETHFNQLTYDDKLIFFDHESQKNGTLHYMFCPGRLSLTPCTIFKEVHHVDNLSTISSCTVSFRDDYKNGTIASRMRILPLNPRRALILWVQMGIDPQAGPFGIGTTNTLRYTIIDFYTCNTTLTILSTNTKIKMTSTVPLFYPSAEGVLRTAAFMCYETFCEISYHDLQCGVGYCKRKIDKDTGELISETEFYYAHGPDIVDIVPVDTRRPYAGCLFFDWEGGKIYRYKRFYGLDQLLWAEPHEDWEKFRYSVRYSIITICKAVEETKINCKQLRFDGTIKMKNKFDLGKRNLSPVPYTWRGGGYLLLTTECDSNCTETTNRLYVVDTDGNLEKVNDIEGFKCNVNKFAQWHTFFDASDGKVCVSLLCYDLNSNMPKEILVQCYNLSEN